MRDRVGGDDGEVVAALGKLDLARPVAVLIRIYDHSPAVRRGDSDLCQWAAPARQKRRLAIDRAHQGGRVRDGQRRYVCETNELPANPAEDEHDGEREQRCDEQCGRYGDATAWCCDWLGRWCHRGPLLFPTDLRFVAPAGQHVFRIEPEIDRVVAQEALGVDQRRQGGVLAVLERGEVLQADLRVALGAEEVDALVLASNLQHVADAWRGRGVDGRAIPPKASITDADVVSGSHGCEGVPLFLHRPPTVGQRLRGAVYAETIACSIGRFHKNVRDG